jgi:hypothetical protein
VVEPGGQEVAADPLGDFLGVPATQKRSASSSGVRRNASATSPRANAALIGSISLNGTPCRSISARGMDGR